MQTLRDQLLAKKLVTPEDAARVEAEQRAEREAAERKAREEREAQAQRARGKQLQDVLAQASSRADVFEYIDVLKPEQYFTCDEKLESVSWSFKRWVAERKAPPDIEHYCVSCGVRGLQMDEARAEVLRVLREGCADLSAQATDEDLLRYLLKVQRETGQPAALMLLSEKHPPNAILRWLPDRRLYEAMLPLGNWIRYKKLHVCIGCLGQGREASIALQDEWRKIREAEACTESKTK